MYLESGRLSLVTCKQRADHFTPMMWFDFIKWRFHFIRGQSHYSECIKYSKIYMILNRISYETHNWDVYATWEIEPQNLDSTQMTSQGGVESQNILLILARICFLWNNIWSLYNGANQWLLEPGWDETTTFNRSHLKMHVRNRWSPIHISHGFAFKLHILHKSDNLLHFEIAYRRCDKPDTVQLMKSWGNYATSCDAC